LVSFISFTRVVMNKTWHARSKCKNLDRA